MSASREVTYYYAPGGKGEYVAAEDYDALLAQYQEVKGWCESQARLLSLLGVRNRIEWHEHEGMATVYASDGTYLGCMGLERWLRLVRDDAEVRDRVSLEESA